MKTKTPTSLTARQGLSGMVLQAGSKRSPTIFALDLQGDMAVRRLVMRFGLPPATASAVAEANRWGRT